MIRKAAALAVVILILSEIYMACLIGVYCLARAGPDPDVIDYDVTSEGPEGDYTPAFYEWEDEDNDMG